MSSFREILRETLSMFLPMTCAGCGASGQLICANCADHLDRAVVGYREIADTLSGHSIPVFSAWRYDAVSAGIINAYKEHGVTALASSLARGLGPALRDLHREIPSWETALWVAPPSSSASYVERGYRPVELLARRAGIRMVPAVAFVRQHVDHAGLDARQREINMAGSLRATSAVSGRRVILFDDVITSGATLRECARAVRVAGGHVIAALTLAQTEL